MIRDQNAHWGRPIHIQTQARLVVGCIHHFERRIQRLKRQTVRHPQDVGRQSGEGEAIRTPLERGSAANFCWQ